MLELTCPHCDNPLQVPEESAGQIGTCPRCNEQFTVPMVPGPSQQAPPSTEGTHGLAVASLVLGILSYFCLGPLLSIPAIITGHMALSKIKHAADSKSGKGIAIAGLILGYGNIVVVFLLFVSLLSALPAMTLPALSEGRGAARRASCQNNLKQMGIVFKMFSMESREKLYPELSSEAGRLMFANKGTNLKYPVFPEYLVDMAVLICPSDRDRGLAAKPGANSDLTLMDDHSYFYLGYMVASDEEVKAFADVYKTRVAEGLAFDEDLTVPEGMGNAGGDTIYRVREGIERELGHGTQSSFPVLIERPENHVPKGGNVLYMDGHVDFLKYPGPWPMTETTIGILESLDRMQ